MPENYIDQKRMFGINRVVQRPEVDRTKYIPPEVDVVKKSAEMKEKMYGKGDKKFQGAGRVWNKNRPLAKGGRRP